MSGEQQAAASAGAAGEASFLSQVIEATPENQREMTWQRGEDQETVRVQDLVQALVGEVQKGSVKVEKDAMRTIKAAIAKIDAVVSKQLAAIMHHPKFQKLEGTWRGLQYLVQNTETSPMLKIKAIQCTKDDMKKDLERAVEFDQSNIWKKMYEDEFGIAGGKPYGALIGDYEFENHPEDIDTLQRMSTVAAAAFCPFITSPAASVFKLNSWTEINKHRDLEKIFDSPEYIKWNAFRDSEDSRFVVMAMPRVLSRLPWGKNTKKVDDFDFEEVPLGPDGNPISVDHNQYCWMNASYVLANRLTDAFAKTGMCVAIRGKLGGGLVEGLPTHVVKTEDGEFDAKCPTEIGITDRREAELSKLGFLSLCHYKNQDYAVFFGGQTIQKPKKYDRPEATANASISSRLPFIMAASRFNHYLKVLARDRIGSFMEREDCEKFLDRWIHNYVSADPNPDEYSKARTPLREAKVEVKEVPGKPGSYQAICWIRPFLQLEELTSSMRLVARIPKRPG